MRGAGRTGSFGASFIPETPRSMKACLLVLTAILSLPAMAQTEATPDFRQAVEIDALWPAFPGAFRAHYTRTLWQSGHWRGDLLAGVNVDFPADRETEGRFADYSLATGYRQYVWKGLHLEVNQTTGVGVLQDHVTTGETYTGFDWLVSGYLGYRFDVAQRWYILPQAGLARVVYKSDPWPVYEDGSLEKEVGESAFPLGSLRAGFRF